MKLITKITFIVLANLIWVLPGFSQSVALKLNLPGLVAGQIGVGVELPVSDRISIGLWAAGLPTSESGFINNTIVDNLDLEEAGIPADVDVEVSGVVLTPEVRFYLSGGGNAPRGFYLGVYGQYYSYSYNSPYEDRFTAGELGIPSSVVSPNESLNVTGRASGFVNNIGGGVMLGNQWVFADIVALDIFLGFGVGNADVALVRVNDIETDRNEAEPFIPEIYQEIARELSEELDDSLGDYLTASSSNDEAEYKGSGLLPTFRLGFAIGIAL